MTATASRSIELNGVFAQMLGVWYPRDYIVAAIDAVEGAAAVDELLAAGFGSNSIHLHESALVCAIGSAWCGLKTGDAFVRATPRVPIARGFEPATAKS